MYIVKSPDLASAVHRSEKTLTFQPLVAGFLSSLSALDSHSAKIVFENALEKGQEQEQTETGLLSAIGAMQKAILSPGPDLDSIAVAQMDEFATALNCLPRDQAQYLSGLYDWVRGVIMPANAKAVYGPNHMFRERPELYNEFWELDEKALYVAMKLPLFMARKAYKARENLLSAAEKYFAQGHQCKASTWVTGRFEIARSFGMSDQMIARLELGNFFAIFILAMPTTFYFIAEVFSRPDVLEDLRSEILNSVSFTKGTDEQSSTCTVSLHTLKADCPLFFSAYREILRLFTNASTTRVVLSDMVLANQYLLRKGSILQIIGRTMHADERIWGYDANEFNPRRFTEARSDTFTSMQDNENTSPRKVHPAAFRSHGGGTVLCSGRHFAQTELLSLTAGLILGFNILRSCGGLITVPQRNEKTLSISMPKPIKDIDVLVTRREGWENMYFKYSL